MHPLASTVRSTLIYTVLLLCMFAPLSKSIAAVPTVEDIDPNLGYAGQQDVPVEVYGQDFEPGAFVVFENPFITVDGPILFVNSTTLQLMIDINLAAPLGPGDVYVFNGIDQGSLDDGFTVLPPDAPIPDSVVPDHGYTGDAGLSVTIIGDLMYSVDDVDFGAGITLDSIDDKDNFTVDCTISIDWLAVPGIRDVTVFSPYGDATIVGGFEVIGYAPPTVSMLTPDFGCQVEVDYDVIVSGSNFLPSVDFEFQPSGITINSIYYDMVNQATLNVDIEQTAPVGYFSIRAINPDGNDFTLPDAFEVLDCKPQIQMVDPTQGYQGDTGLAVSIYGTNLADPLDVDFGSGITVNVFSTSDNQIDVLLDIAPLATVGFRDVTVTGFYGDGVMTNGFEVLQTIFPPPIIDSVDPTSALQGTTGLPVTIYGEALDSVDTVDFGAGISVNVLAVTEGSIDCIIDIQPTAMPGFRDVFVDSPFGDDTLLNAFEVITAPPMLLTVFPGEGERGTIALPVVITGIFLSTTQTVDFGPGIAVTVTGITDTEVNVELDINILATPGFRDVSVTTDGGEDTLPGAFDVVIGPLSIDAVIPDNGAQGETIDVIITGENLDQASDVDFGAGISVNTWNAVALNQIDANLTIDPLADVGFRDVTVTDVNALPFVLINGFEITAAPIVDPVVIDLDPAFGYQGDEDLQIIVTGQGFQDGLTIDFGHPGITVNGLIFGSSTSFQVFIDISEDASPGFTDVVVTNPDNGQGALINGFEVREATVVPPLILDSFAPGEGYPGDVLDFEIVGSGIQEGAQVAFFPFGEFFDIDATVASATLIEGTLTIFDDAPVMLYSVTVTNPDSNDAVLIDVFEVLPPIVPPPPPVLTDIVPATVCIGAVGEVFTLYGNYFQDGITVEFEYGGVPTGDIYDVDWSFVDSTTLNITLSVLDDAFPGFYDIRVTNPDGEEGAGALLEVIDCTVTEGNLSWQENLLDIFAEYEGLPGGLIEATTLGHLLNTGNGGYENVVISMTDLVSSDGLRITPENVEIWPSIVGEFPAGGEQEVNVMFSIPVGEDLMVSGGVFMGSMVAQDTVTWDTASLPITFTILTPGSQAVEVDEICLQVDLLSPGASANLVPDLFSPDVADNASEIAIMLGGCQSPFPVFQWASYASGCPGYMELWQPVYTLSVYSVYPGNSAEEAVANVPVWQQTGIYDTSIQYPGFAEPLDGFYLWRIEAVPEAMPGLALFIDQFTPITSDIWAFCVEEGAGAQPEIPSVAGEIAWFPEEKYIGGVGMVAETLVISNDAIDDVGSETPMSLWLEDASGQALTLELDVAGLQFSDWNPMPSYGPAAITFGINVTPNGFIGEGMGPSDLTVQIYNGGIYLGELQPSGNSDGNLTLGADIGGSTAECHLVIQFPWDQGSCWEIWLEWVHLKAELAEDCPEERDNVDRVRQTGAPALADYEAATTALEEAITTLEDEQDTLYEARRRFRDSRQACTDFFVEHMSSPDISFSSPGLGWSYIEAFGGEVGIWFNGDNGAELLNDFIDQYSEEYGNLWDELRAAREEQDSAEAEYDDALRQAREAEEARGEALQSLIDFLASRDAAGTALSECLTEKQEIADAIYMLEWLHPECFRTSQGMTTSGLGTPGLEGGPQLPPIDESWPGPNETGITGGGEGPGSGIGTFNGVCNCGDCYEEWDKLQEAEVALREGRYDLEYRQNNTEGLTSAIGEASMRLEDARNALDQAQNNFDVAQNNLDTFMEKHVFSDTIGGTPEYGDNHIIYRGVDIYFSDYAELSGLFHLIMDQIDDAEDELTEAEDILYEARRAFREADHAELNAENSLARQLLQINDLTNRLIAAENNLFSVRETYDECVGRVEQCMIARGCSGEVMPEEQGIGDSDASILPYGQSTGSLPGVEDCPCDDCQDEFVDWYEALEVSVEADRALKDAEVDLEANQARLNELQQRVNEINNLIRTMIEGQAMLDRSDPLQAEQYEATLVRIEEERSNLMYAEMGLGSARFNFNIAQSVRAEAIWNAANATTNANAASEAYFKCTGELRQCEQDNGCPPSVLPHEAAEGWDIPIGSGIPQFPQPETKLMRKKAGDRALTSSITMNVFYRVSDNLITGP